MIWASPLSYAADIAWMMEYSTTPNGSPEIYYVGRRHGTGLPDEITSISIKDEHLPF